MKLSFLTNIDQRYNILLNVIIQILSCLCWALRKRTSRDLCTCPSSCGHRPSKNAKIQNLFYCLCCVFKFKFSSFIITMMLFPLLKCRPSLTESYNDNKDSPLTLHAKLSSLVCVISALALAFSQCGVQK